MSKSQLRQEQFLVYYWRWQAGDKLAREDILKHVEGLVITVAKRYKGRSLSNDDLMQEGRLGVLAALEKYNPHKGVMFSTYVTYWIRQAMTRAIEKQDRMIRLSTHRCIQLRQLEKAELRLGNQLGRDPTLEELAREMELSVDDVKGIRSIPDEPLSLDEVMKSDESEGDHFIDSIPDSCKTYERFVDHEVLQQVITEAKLKPREARVVMRRFGLDGEEPCTLNQLSEELQMSREGVRHVEIRALRKLRERAENAGFAS